MGFFFFFGCLWDLLWPGIKPVHPSLEAWSQPLDHQGNQSYFWVHCLLPTWIVTESPNMQIHMREEPRVERRPWRVAISPGQLVTRQQLVTRSTSPLASRRPCCCCLVTQSCLTLCDPMDSSPPGSPICGVSQERILQWVAISFSRGSSRPRDQTHVSCIGRRVLYQWAAWEAPRRPTRRQLYPQPHHQLWKLKTQGPHFIAAFSQTMGVRPPCACFDRGAVFPAAFPHFVFLCHMLLILKIFQMLHSDSIFHADPWSSILL